MRRPILLLALILAAGLLLVLLAPRDERPERDARANDAAAGPAAVDPGFGKSLETEATRHPAAERAPAPIRVSGTLLEQARDGERVPVAHQPVSALLVDDAAPDDEPLLETETDADGAFRFEWTYARSDAIYVKLAHPGDAWFAAVTKEKHVPGETGVLEGIELVRKPRPALAGTTVDVDGEPLAGVQVFHEAPDGRTASVFSDGDGAFFIPAFLGEISRAEKPGYRLIRDVAVHAPTRDAPRTIRLVFARTGEVELEVLGSDGRPEDGLSILVDLSGVEPIRKAKESGLAPKIVEYAKTNELGVVRFGEVWAEHLLRIQLHRYAGAGEPAHFTTSFHRDGRLCLLGEPGDPLIVAPDTTLSLKAVLPSMLRIHGEVRTPDGALVEKKYVELVPLGSATSGETRRTLPLGHDARTAGPAPGHYEVLVPPEARTGDYLLVASDLDFSWGGPDEPPGRYARELLHLDRIPGDELRLDLVMRETLALAGRVLAADGAPAAGTVRARMVDEQEDRIPAHALPPPADIEESGAFRLGGLAAGSYELLVRTKRDGTRFEHAFGPFRAGETGLELRLPETAAVQVVVAVESPAEVSSLSAALVSFDPSPRWSEPPAPCAALVVQDGTRGWPAGAPFMVMGQSGWNDPTGHYRAEYQRSRTNEYAFPPRQAGWYLVGALATDADGNRTYPIGVGPVYLSGGSYRFVFSPMPTGTVEGRLRGAAPPWHLALADGDGRLVPVRGASGGLTPSVPVGGRGGFLLRDAPAGSWQLVAGPQAELQAGRPRHRCPVTIVKGANPVLDLALP